MQCINPWYSEKLRRLLPCHKCAFCIKKNIDAWCLRLYHEMEVSSSAYFITLTYNDEHIPDFEELSKRDLCLFIKRLRKKNPGLRYFAVGEYGTNGHRPHYHAIMFNLDTLDLVDSAWRSDDGEPIGFIKGDRATMGRIRYMVSYMALPQDVVHRQPPFRVMSRMPGIGHTYIKKNAHFHRARSDATINVLGTVNAMPRYYKDKIFTNRYQKKLLQVNAMAYSSKHPVDPGSVHELHERLSKKLNRKQK